MKTTDDLDAKQKKRAFKEKLKIDQSNVCIIRFPVSDWLWRLFFIT